MRRAKSRLNSHSFSLTYQLSDPGWPVPSPPFLSADLATLAGPDRPEDHREDVRVAFALQHGRVSYGVIMMVQFSLECPETTGNGNSS